MEKIFMWMVLKFSIASVMGIANFTVIAPNTYQLGKPYSCRVVATGYNIAQNVKLSLCQKDLPPFVTFFTLIDNLEREISFEFVETTNISEITLRAEYAGNPGTVFEQTIKVILKKYSVLIQADKAVYKPGDKVQFRVIVLDADLKPYPYNSLNIVISDGTKQKIAEKSASRSDFGVHEDSLQLANELNYGKWAFHVVVDGKKGEVHSKLFEVVDYKIPSKNIVSGKNYDERKPQAEIDRILRRKRLVRSTENQLSKRSFDTWFFKSGAVDSVLETSWFCEEIFFAVALVIGGKRTNRGQWPFMVALIDTSSQIFFCGGVLISKKHVLTAAHCVHRKHESNGLEPQDITIWLGRININATLESGWQARRVSEIVINPSWNISDDRYDADIAILVMNRIVAFTRYIRPACLDNDPDLHSMLGGTVVGWGKGDDKSSFEKIQKQVNIEIVSDAECFQAQPDLGNIFSNRSFCAGGKGVGPCLGDSGGGMFAFLNNRWTLKGLVSATVSTNIGDCDVHRYSLYTRVSDFIVWIKAILLLP